MDFWAKLFDTTGFVPRAQCGDWTAGLIRLHNLSDFFIWTAYLAIPVVLVSFAWRRRNELPFRQLFWLFGLFIIACGTTHLMDIVLFYSPVYRFAGLVKLVTAAASWGTVLALIPIVPRALAMRTPEALEREIQERQRAEEQVRQLNTELERRVLERTAELEAANQQKDDLLVREQEARAEAEAANRAKDEFLATLSHELRTPLNAILGWVTLLRGGQLDAATAAQAMETVERNTRMQSQLINDILDVSRIITGKLPLDARSVDLVPVIEDALSTIRPAAQAKNIDVQVAVDPATGPVSGDANRLQQVVWNLLSNAIKFTPKGGRVNVTLRRVDSLAEITVSDNGQGISPEFLPHVFERFSQADAAITRMFGGLGLGLAIVRHLVELHGGTVHAASDGSGQGATLTVCLPLLAVHAPDLDGIRVAGFVQAAPAGDLLPGNLENLRVLVVDDEADARALVTAVLQMQGAETRAAASVTEALTLLTEWPPNLLLSDIGMPGEDGYSLMRKIRAMDSPAAIMPAIALTAYASPDDRERALAAGFQQHISKPVDPQVLTTTVMEVAGRAPGASASVEENGHEDK